MLTIRLARTGKRNSAKFKIMLQEKGAAPGGKHIEILGSHDPHLKKTVLKGERIKYWLSQGTQVSDTAHNLFVKNELITDKKRVVKLPKKVVEAVVAESAPEAEKKEEAVAA